MQSATFLGEVQGGQIVTKDALTEFEGKKVYVTLIAPDETTNEGVPTKEGESNLPPAETSEEAELLKDLGRIEISRGETATIAVRVIDGGIQTMPVYESDLEE